MNLQDKGHASYLIISVIVVGLDSLHQLCKGTLILRVNLGESNTGTSFPVHQSPQPGLALDDAVWHSHLAAQSWQEDHQLNGVYIMGNHHKLSFLVLYQSCDSVNTCPEDWWSLSWSISLSCSFLFSTSQQPLLLLLLSFWPVFVCQLQKLRGCLAIQSLTELVDCRGHLQALVQNGALALQPDVAGPFHKAGEITLGLDILSNAKVLGPLLKEGIDNLLGLLLLDYSRGRCHLLALGLFS